MRTPIGDAQYEIPLAIGLLVCASFNARVVATPNLGGKMPLDDNRRPLCEPLESRVLLETAYDFIGSSSWTPDPNSPYVATGNMGDRHYLEPGLSATPPISGFLNGHNSGTSTSFSITSIPEHDELSLSFSMMSKQPTYPIGPEGPEPEDPPPTIVWKYEVWFDDHYRWWHTDGSGWGGDPLHFVHYDDSLSVTIKGTLIVGSGSKWILTNAQVERFTPMVFMYARDTAIENKTDYAPGTEPGFVISRSGDTKLGGLDVGLSAPVGTAQAGSDFMQLPDGATIPATQGEVFVPLSVIPGTDIEWTEDLSVSLKDGEGYLLGNSSSGTLRIQDDDPVDIAADDLPEEVEDEEYNETNPGLYLLLNDDDDDEDGVIDGWESSPPGGDGEMVEVLLRFQSDEKIIGVPPSQQEAEVTLSLSSPRFRVWHNGSLLLGGPAGPLYIVLDHAALEGTMTVMVEFVPPPNPVPGEPYVAEDPFTAVSANLTLQAQDVGARAFNSLDILRLVGTRPTRVKQLSFAATEAGKFYTIHRDVPDPNLGATYAAPHWVDEDLNGTPEIQYPAAFRRESKMKVTVELFWGGEEELGQNTQVRGDGPHTYDFFGSAGGDPDPFSNLQIQGDTLTLTDAAAAAFPNWIDHFDTFDIDWSISVDGGQSWVQAGTTKNRIYSLLDAPTSTLYHTIAHLATAPPAKGLSDPGAVVAAIWSQFSDRNVRRVDGRQLSYYGFRDENGNGTWDVGVDTNFNTTALCSVTTTEGLLRELNGQCNSWAEFFRDTVRAHGIASQQVQVLSKDDYFAIKQWTTLGPAPWRIISVSAGVDGSAPGAPAAGEAADGTGVPGQGHSPNPPSAFENHWIIRIGANYYDPSYGLGPFTDLKVYEDAAFAGTVVLNPPGLAAGAWLYEKPPNDGDPQDQGDLIATYVN